MSRILMAVGFLVALFSIFFVVVFFSDLITGENTEPGIALGGTIFFALTSVAGGYLFLSSFKKSRRKKEQRLEDKLFQLIASRKGRVTPIELAMDCELNVEECRGQLEAMSSKGYCRIQVTDQGNVLYVFDDMIPESEKLTAHDPLGDDRP